MAIEVITGPAGSSPQGAGQFTLPPNFDTRKFAAKWVLKGNEVSAAAEREYIIGTNLTADGWAVWKDGEDGNGVKGKPHTAHVKKGEHILLFRPRSIQNAVNAIYGNVGKQRMMAEKKGHTIGGESVRDSGLLGEEKIAKVLGSEGLQGEEGDVQLNPVNLEEPVVHAEELQTAG